MGFLDNIFKRGNGQATASDLRAALSEIDMTALDRDVAAAEAGRVDALVSGTDGDVRQATQKLAAAELARDRGRARYEELQRRAAEAELNEKRATLQARRDAVAEHADNLAARLGPEYRELASGLVALLSELRDCEQAVREINAEITQAGVVGEGVEPVARIEVRALPQSPVEQVDLHSILNWTQLRRFGADPSIPHWAGGASPQWSTAVPPRGADIPPFISSSPRVALK